MNKIVSMRSETISSEKSAKNPFAERFMPVSFPFLDVRSVLNLLCVNQAVHMDMTAFLELFRSPYARLSTPIQANAPDLRGIMGTLELSVGDLGYGSDKVIPHLLPAPPRLTREQIQAIPISPTTIVYLSLNPANAQPLADVHIQLGARLRDPQATPLSKKWAAEALFDLSANPANSQPLVAAGVHTQLGALLISNRATPDAKQAAAGALWNLSINAVNRLRLVEAGVHNSLRAFLNDPEVTARGREFSERALANLNERSWCTVS